MSSGGDGGLFSGLKKNGAEVYDYLMSLDYGICWGPVDAITRIRIKDKRIFGGAITGNTTLNIDKPDLFGDDAAEGGVGGAVECYLGGDTQKATTNLASRFNRTPDTMPGYRGLAHVFFRGARKLGFKWATNNPYMPAADVSVTRIPKGLPGVPGMIYPFAGYENGQPIEIGDFLFQANSMTYEAKESEGDTVKDPEIDISGLNLTEAQLQAGVNCNFQMAAYAKRTALAGGGDAEGQIGLTLRFKDSGGTEIGTYDAGITNGFGLLTLDTGDVPIPVGTSSILLDTFYLLVVGIGSYWEYRHLDGQIAAAPALGPNGQTLNNRAHITNDKMGWLPGANPASIIYECMVNDEWGKGEDPLNIDTASFQTAATTLRSELFGLSLKWKRQTDIEGFVQNILNHINAVMFQHPATGLWTLRLLRDDYDPNLAPLFDETNSRATDRKRRAWGETVNEIIVEWVNPETEEKATVAAHDLANISVQGGVTSETRSYEGIRSEWLANQVARRDVREASYPLFGCTLHVNRTNWDIVPGDVVRFAWPEDGINEMVLRVLAVDYGSPKSREISLKVVEDVFGLARTSYGDVQGSEWVTDRVLPSPLDAKIAMAMPLPVMTRLGAAIADVDADYPKVAVGLLAADDSGDTVNVEVHTEAVLANGSTVVKAVTTIPPTPTDTLQAALAPEVTSILPGDLVASVLAGSEAVGRFLMLGSDVSDHEIVMLDTYDDVNDEWTVLRGVWDTVPGTWAIGTRVWEFPIGTSRADPGERSGGETRTYRLLPATIEGRLAYDEAADLTATFSERPHLPFRPANTQLDGNGFGLADHTQDQVVDAVATWENRNRGTEDSIPNAWDEGEVTPETNQTVVLQVYDEFDALQNEITGLTGTTYTVTEADRSGTEFGYIRFLAERDGLRSFQGSDRWFDFRASGYGNNYGNFYG